MAKYALGIDFGTLSARALLVLVENGEPCASFDFAYPNGVLDERLPGGEPLSMDWALQHPADYIVALQKTIAGVLETANADAADVVGLCIDFTCCTMIPTDETAIPLCFKEEYTGRPHAYAKLWKHHAAQPQADRMTALAKAMDEPWLPLRGGRVSPEWLYPKALQMLEEDPAMFEASKYYLEAGDWLNWLLTGKRTRNVSMAGYRAMYEDEQGPSLEFLTALNPAFASIEEKVQAPVLPLGGRVGCITQAGASLCGLLPGTPVAAAVMDAHVSMAGAGVVQPGALLAIIGTSTCHLTLGREQAKLDGICGVVKDGMIPGFYGYEAGQSCVGDHFSWLVDRLVPKAYHEAAQRAGLDIHSYLCSLVQDERPGENGLLALDWWNGNRSILIDGDLSGLILGMTLSTKAEHIYRALIEATAFGTRAIIENYSANGIPISSIVATGGIASKNPFLMQLYADVCGLPIYLADSSMGGALGAAVFAAVAAGSEGGGYADAQTAIEHMVRPPQLRYMPNEQNHEIYGRLYAQYMRLHDLMGRDEHSPMKELKRIRRDVLAANKEETPMNKTIIIGCDNAAVKLKAQLTAHLGSLGYNVQDVGCADENDLTAYPLIAKALCEKMIAGGLAHKGILLCGTGLGMCITANKFPGIRATVCHDSYSAERSVLSNNANVLCMGERVIGLELAKKIVTEWLSLEFVEGSSSAKIQAIQEIEQNNMK